MISNVITCPQCFGFRVFGEPHDCDHTRGTDGTHCVQCDRLMNPVQIVLGATCLDCCKHNQARANGKKP